MTSDQIVTCARLWLGTRFHHQGRLKKTPACNGGVDCLGLLVGVAQELELRSRHGEMLQLIDRTDYTHYPDTHELRAKLAQHLHEIDVSDMAPGDVLLLNIDRRAQHLAIVSGVVPRISIIHAYAPAKRVVEHVLDAQWQDNIVTVFRTA
jgi:cell wall-associated NlpC family hydrolase